MLFRSRKSALHHPSHSGSGGAVPPAAAQKAGAGRGEMEGGKGWVSASGHSSNSPLVVLPNRAFAQSAGGECRIKGGGASALHPVTPARNAGRARALGTMPRGVKTEWRGSMWGARKRKVPLSGALSGGWVGISALFHPKIQMKRRLENRVIS